EGKALLRIFSKVPPFSATKSYTGHTLAAAGAIQAVYSILSLQMNVTFPTLNFNTKIKEFDLTPSTDVVNTNITHVLSNAIGFGGTCCSLLFSKCSKIVVILMEVGLSVFKLHLVICLKIILYHYRETINLFTLLIRKSFLLLCCGEWLRE